MKKIYSVFSLLLLSQISVFAQCPAGQSEVFIEVHTDAYGYEIYWQLVPVGNACGTGTLFEGGNVLVGCNGAGAQTQNPGGYGDMIDTLEGPWCLTDNASYDIIYVDDWGDAGADFTINIGGFPMYGWSEASGSPASVYTFTVTLPLQLDMQGEKLLNDTYVQLGNVDIRAMFYNVGADTITSFDYNYQIDNGSVITTPVTGITLDPFTGSEFVHPTPWNVSTNGAYQIKSWASNVNGGNDMDNSNDTIVRIVEAGPGILNLVDNYIGMTPTQTVIANSGDGIVVPRDLDFHPILTRNELWVILKSTEANGGKTVKISNAGLGGQTELVQQDGNAWHFMSLPTALAFSPNENFATAPGVFDANHNGGSPFTGPTLWSSDPLIYAQPSGGNGSHLDMLHESPYSMGIASEKDNAFWLTDGDSYCVTYYDFKADHGPGNSDHSDGIVRKYLGMGLSVDPAYHVASHLVVDQNSNWVYIADTGNDRIVRLDRTSGSVLNPFTPMEATAESSIMGSYIQEDYITTGLTEPSGIDIIEDRMIVSDHATGDIVIYDISGATGVELGRIVTGTPGIMGVKIGPDGRIWYVNATTNEVVKLEYAAGVGVEENMNSETNVLVYPNPANGNVLHLNTDIEGNYSATVLDVTGKIILNLNLTNFHSVIDISTLSAGTYFLNVVGENNQVEVKKFTVTR